MAGRKAGDVWVAIHPDAALFGTQARENIRRAMTGIRAEVPVTADTKPAVASIEALRTRMSELAGKLAALRLTADSKQAEATVAKLQVRMQALAHTVASLTMKADTTRLDADIAAEKAKLTALQQQAGDLKMDADTTAAIAKIAGLEKQAARWRAGMSKLKTDVDIRAAVTKLAAIEAQLKVLRSDAQIVKLAADKTALDAAITASQTRIAALSKEASDIRMNVDVHGVMAAEAGLLGLEAAFGKLAPAAAAGDVALGVMGKALVGTGRGWGFLTRSVTLFGGVLNRVLPVVAASVAVWHVLADVIIELAAVWIPATLAVGAFAVAASDAAVEIQQRMQAVHTVMDATGQAVPPMTNAMEKLHDAVRPQVFQLFGDALTVMNSRAGLFSTVARGTGTVLTQLAARITYAITSGKGFSSFMGQAVTDVSKLGDSIGNVFGIFGNLFKAIPGFAAGLLTIGDDFTKILETASAAAVPVLKWILLLHGYILYTGLAFTATLAFIGGVANLAKQFVTFAKDSVLAGVGAIKSFALLLAGIGESLLVYAANIAIAGTATGAFRAALLPLAANPMLWVAAAAVALGALVVWIGRSKDAAQQFNDTMQHTITTAQLSSLSSTIQGAQAATTVKLAQATSTLNQALAEQGARTGQASRSWGNETAAVYNAHKAISELTGAHVQLDAQTQLVNGRIGILSKQYGGNAQALGALNAAGITSEQLLKTGAQAWAEIKIQVASTLTAYAAMGTQSGVLGNDLDVLGRTMTSQYQSIQKLNTGWATFIADVTGTQGSFDTVAQGFFTLNDHAGKLSFSLGKLKVKYADQKAAIDSLTPAGVALNQAFGEQVGNLDKLFASWRTAGLAGNLFTAGVKNGIAPMVKYARGSQEATAQLVALAQEAGYQGPISMQALTKWLGNTHGATAKLKDITGQATTQEALLTGAMQNQGTFIANQLLGDINSAILAYDGVGKAVGAYGRAVAQTGKGSDEANAKMTKAIGAIVKSGMAMESSVPQMGAIVAKVFGISMPDAIARVKKAIDATVAGLPPARKSFELFAMEGLGKSRDEADKLWKKFAASNLGELAAKAGTTRETFDKLASKGLNISTAAADVLWQHLRKQYLDTLATKAGVSRSAFEKLAASGLNLTKDAADKLWAKLRMQYLDTVANKSDMTKKKFEDLARQMGISKDAADKLWGSLHKVASGSPYKATVITEAHGTGQISITGTGWALGQGNVRFHAAQGAYIQAGSGPTADDVPAMLSRGEVVVPTRMVNAGAVDHLRGKIPGFAAGGLIGGGLAGMGSQAAAMPGEARTIAGGLSGKAVKAAMTQVIARIKAQVLAAAAAASGSGDIVSYARSFLGRIPYQMGGTSLKGMDCSAFTGMVYRHAGYRSIPRTSEAQSGWATQILKPQAGALAFYHSPAGGPDPGHVAIIDTGGTRIISQGGGMGPKLESIHALPLLSMGVPPGGFKVPAGGSGPSSASAAQAQAYARGRMGAYGWPQSMWPSLQQLWQGESGWNRVARNPSSGAYGIPQALPASKMGAAANPPASSASAQIDWGMGYIRSVYGNPFNAFLRWQSRSPHWYSRGGLVPGMAAGGTVAGLRSRLAGEQKGERAKYAGLAHSFAAGPAKYRTKTVVSELGTLARHQAAEQLAYAQLSGSGLTSTRLHHFGVTARAAERTAGDQALNRLPGGHPGFAHDLRKYLHDLSVTASGSVPAGSGSGSGGGGGGSGGPGNIKVPVPVLGSFFKDTAALRSALAGAEKGEKAKYFGLHHSYETGPAKYLTKTVRSELATLGKRQSAELSAYAALSGTGLVPGNLGKLGSAAKAETRTAQDQALMRGGPGGHPLWDADLRRNLARIISVTNAGLPGATGTGAGGLPVLGPVAHTYGGDVGVADTIGAFLHQAAMPFARGGMATSFDQGGWLQPGTTLAYNGTGKPEPVGGAGAVNVTVQLEWAGRNGGDELMALLRKAVRVRGGGNVQRALGTPGTVSGSNTWRSG